MRDLIYSLENDRTNIKKDQVFSRTRQMQNNFLLCF